MFIIFSWLAGLQVAEDSSEHFSAWHQFLLLCTLPCFAAIAGLIFSPESPRHLLEVGQDVEAMLAYQRIFKVSAVFYDRITYKHFSIFLY
jgi:hypothetical protein